MINIPAKQIELGISNYGTERSAIGLSDPKVQRKPRFERLDLAKPKDALGGGCRWRYLEDDESPRWKC